MRRTVGGLALGPIALAASGCFSGVSLNGETTYTGAPPATTATSSNETIDWGLIEGHLAWARGDAILVADAAQQRLTRLSYSGATAIWEGSVALSPDATRVALAAILNFTWPYRLFVSSVTGGATVALLPLDPSGEREDWPSWTPDGLDIVFPDQSPVEPGPFSVEAIHPDGNGLSTLPVFSSFGPIAISPDGASAAVALDDGIYVSALDGSGMRRIAASPLGRALYGPTWADGGVHIYVVDTASGESSPLTTGMVFEDAPSWVQ